MNYEKEIFKRQKVKIAELIAYGFREENSLYKYSTMITDCFRLDIIVDKQGNLSSKIFDLSVDEEYIIFHIDSQCGEFVSEIRKRYQSILDDIRDKCFENIRFTLPQTNRIVENIKNLYNNNPEFLWDNSPGCAVFRHSNNRKWYALIMDIDLKKIDENLSGEVEIINVKIDKNRISEIIENNGIYLAYHMNKKSWISIVLNDTLSDDEVMNYIYNSYMYTKK